MTCAPLIDFICLTRPQLCHWICRAHLRFFLVWISITTTQWEDEVRGESPIAFFRKGGDWTFFLGGDPPSQFLFGILGYSKPYHSIFFKDRIGKDLPPWLEQIPNFFQKFRLGDSPFSLFFEGGKNWHFITWAGTRGNDNAAPRWKIPRYKHNNDVFFSSLACEEKDARWRWIGGVSCGKNGPDVSLLSTDLAQRRSKWQILLA